ncbi:uncharacterized protein LOC130688056 [Daphnia carinata]|uniref:uncharacterized protein LOC130688056 n=1 Tax=Daphnia carinata TaxID=120202 RepID=UPI00257A53FA|nr:uncharacterized protein LOC130688056 [Daphnia carinata]
MESPFYYVSETEEVIPKKECWNGKKTATQVAIDAEATECFLGLLKDKWAMLSDSKTGKRQLWHCIATELEEAGFSIRGSDKIQMCKTKWENLRKVYRGYISKNIDL